MRAAFAAALIALLVALVGARASAAGPPAQPEPEPMLDAASAVALFDGDSLTGWTARGCL